MFRELDALVAKKVMGWIHGPDGWLIPFGMPAKKTGLSQFTTDPSADYEVLKHVREHWNTAQLLHGFDSALVDIWNSRRRIETMVCYEPGDYSKAALKALGEEI